MKIRRPSSNPVGSLKRWHTEATNKAPVKYQEAIQQFEKDVATLKGWDGKEEAPALLNLSPRQDQNPEPGAVKVEGVGELTPTDSGFDITVQDKPRRSMFGLSDGERSYEVDTDNGTITVFQERVEVGPKLFDEGMERAQTLESFTLDTEQGLLLNYQSVASEPPKPAVPESLRRMAEARREASDRTHQPIMDLLFSKNS